jgi:hypothetical protein
MTLARQRLGRSAERLVASRLAAQGFSIVARNARIHTTEAIGEIDLIARWRYARVRRGEGRPSRDEPRSRAAGARR